MTDMAISRGYTRLKRILHNILVLLIMMYKNNILHGYGLQKNIGQAGHLFRLSVAFLRIILINFLFQVTKFK
jgi:hypothetical protein